MRNLKRALSLTLASVMLLGMMVVGSSAAGYPDVDENDNVEAIEVLQAVQVMRGDENGNFDPDRSVTRAEMAVVMALLLDLDYEYYEATCPFTDVPSWARSYVGACYANKIVAGYNATTYGANDGVTPVQAASMLMRALGYFKYDVDYADGFETATVRQGTSIGIFDGVGSSASAQMTRNQVAQMALNALECGMVEPSSNSLSITTPDGFTVSQGRTNYVYVVGRDPKVTEAINTTKAEAGNSNSGLTGAILDLGEQLYQGELRKVETTDDFGRPATRWTYKTNEVGVYVTAPSVYKSWTAKVAKNELYSLLGGGNAGKLNLVTSEADWDADGSNQLIVYVDGAVQAGKTKKDYIDRDNTGAAGGFAGKGVLTEVFQDNDNNVTLTFINTYLMQATADYSESTESVRVTTLTGPARDNVLKAEDYSGLEGIKEDDYILYTYANNEIQSGMVAEKVTGEVTAYSVALNKTEGDAGGSVTLDGTKRDYAKWAEVDDKNGCAVEYKLGADASIVLDKYGYVIYVDDSSLSVGNYVYIYAIAPQTNLRSNFDADAFFTDGTRDTITVKELKAWDAANKKYSDNLATGENVKNKIEADGKIGGYTLGGWYSYSKNSKDQYTLEAAKTNTVFTANDGGSLKIETNKVSVGGAVAGDKNTIFVVLGPNNKVTSYTGIANVAEITGATADKSFFMRNKDNSGKNAIAVFIDASKGAVRNGNSDLLYLLNEDTHERRKDSATGETIYTWNVILVKDGVAEKTTVETIQSSSEWAKKAIYESYGIDTDNFYELTDDDEFDKVHDSDNVKENVANQEMFCDGETFTWGSKVSLVVDGADTKGTALVVYPDKDTDEGKALADLVNMDEDATYKVYTNVSGKYIANMFRDYGVNGSIYAVKETKTDKIKSMIVVAEGITGTAEPSTPSTSTTGATLDPNDDTKIILTFEDSISVKDAEKAIEKMLIDVLEETNIESVTYSKAGKKVTVKYSDGRDPLTFTVTTKSASSEAIAGGDMLNEINTKLPVDTIQNENELITEKSDKEKALKEVEQNLKALQENGANTLTDEDGVQYKWMTGDRDGESYTGHGYDPSKLQRAAGETKISWLIDVYADALDAGELETDKDGTAKLVASLTLTATKADGTKCEIVITVKVADKAASSAADIQAILTAAEALNKSENQGTATLKGSTITLTNSEALPGLDYITTKVNGQAGAAQSTHDMVQFLVALNNAKATKIVYDNKEYTWNTSNSTEASKWTTGTGDQATSLVKAIGDKVLAAVTAEMKNDPTAITVNVGTLTATMADKSTLDITFVLQLNDIGKGKEAKLVTSTGVEYGDLTTLLGKAGKNAEITLLENLDKTGTANSDLFTVPATAIINLDLNGKSIKGSVATSGKAVFAVAGELNVTGEGTITAVQGTGNDRFAYAVRVDKDGAASFEGTTITGVGTIFVSGGTSEETRPKTELTLTDCVVENTLKNGSAILTNGGHKSGGTITVTGSTIKSEGGGLFLAAGNIVCDLSGVTITSKNSGVAMKSSELTISNSTITATEEFSGTPATNNNGFTTDHSAVFIELNKSYTAGMKLTIDDNTVLNAPKGGHKVAVIGVADEQNGVKLDFNKTDMEGFKDYREDAKEDSGT